MFVIIYELENIVINARSLDFNSIIYKNIKYTFERCKLLFNEAKVHTYIHTTYIHTYIQMYIYPLMCTYYMHTNIRMTFTQTNTHRYKYIIYLSA